MKKLSYVFLIVILFCISSYADTIEFTTPITRETCISKKIDDGKVICMFSNNDINNINYIVQKKSGECVPLGLHNLLLLCGVDVDYKDIFNNSASDINDTSKGCFAYKAIEYLNSIQEDTGLYFENIDLDDTLITEALNNGCPVILCARSSKIDSYNYDSNNLHFFSIIGYSDNYYITLDSNFHFLRYYNKSAFTDDSVQFRSVNILKRRE